MARRFLLGRSPKTTELTMKAVFLLPLLAATFAVSGVHSNDVHLDIDGQSDDERWQQVEATLYVMKIFERYGDDDRLPFEGFEHLLEGLGLGNLVIHDHEIHDHRASGTFKALHESDHRHRADVTSNRSISDDGERDVVKRSIPHHEHNHEDIDSKCLTPEEILQIYKIEKNATISVDSFLHLCPAILVQIDHDACHVTDDHDDDRLHFEQFHGLHHHYPEYYLVTENDTVAVLVKKSFLDIPGKVWGYAVLSVTIISLVGLFCVAIVPVMNKLTYDYLVQFLVALAVGTLTGDALLHLIPHSLVAHSHEEGDEEGEGHNEAVYKGCVVLGGIYLFFLTERLMVIVSDVRKRRKNQTPRHHNKDQLEMEHFKQGDDDIGERLSRYNEYINSSESFPSQTNNHVSHEADPEELQNLEQHGDSDSVVTMDISKHGDDDHCHGHGHSHETPKSISSIAWMVIMGDGLHNFTDGLAIGAAFGASITVGLSTSIAVFCHELPHELGDFAVLLKAGMSVKLALFYNIVSSVLCFIGLVIGVAIGNITSAGGWIFAFTAGIFIYIALVDMLPEITPKKKAKTKKTICHLCLQILGISSGVSVMLLIALYESRIKVG